MRNSSRSGVDPFIVMDVMEAARQAEAAGRRVIHMEVGAHNSGHIVGTEPRLNHPVHKISTAAGVAGKT